MRSRRSPSAPRRCPDQCSAADGPWPHPLAERRSAKGGGWESTEHLIPHRAQSPPQAGLLVPSNHGFTLAIPKSLPVAPNAPHLGAGYFKGVPLKPLLQTDSPWV